MTDDTTRDGAAADRGSLWLAVARWAGVFCLLGAAVIHISVIEEHLAEWRPAGLTFIVLAMVEGALAVGVALFPSGPVLLLAIWVSQATIALWVLSRSIGIPFGPEAFEPEPVGTADLTATLLEVITVAVLIPVFLARRRVRSAGTVRPALYVVVPLMAIAVAVPTWLAVAEAETCGSHSESVEATGPLVPIDGHSILERHTPGIEVRPGERAGLVLGLLVNCGDDDLTVRSARLLSPSNFEAAVEIRELWVMPPATAEPGKRVAVLDLRRAGIPLTDSPTIEPGDERGPYATLVLEVSARTSGSFLVSAVELTYEAEGQRYRSAYATIAGLEVVEPASTPGKNEERGEGRSRCSHVRWAGCSARCGGCRFQGSWSWAR